MILLVRSVEVPDTQIIKLLTLRATGEAPDLWWGQPLSCRNRNQLNRLFLISCLGTCTPCSADAVVTLNSAEQRGRGKQCSRGMRRVRPNSLKQKWARLRFGIRTRCLPASLGVLTLYSGQCSLRSMVSPENCTPMSVCTFDPGGRPDKNHERSQTTIMVCYKGQAIHGILGPMPRK